MWLSLYERMCLTASSRPWKQVYAYEKMCTYKKGALNSPSLWNLWYMYYAMLVVHINSRHTK